MRGRKFLISNQSISHRPLRETMLDIENVHHLREILDEVFGVENFVSEIILKKTSGLSTACQASSPPRDDAVFQPIVSSTST